MVQNAPIIVIGAALAVVMALWSTRAVSPLWPAFVFAIGHGALSFFTGATTATVVGTVFASLVLGALFFWVLQRAQGRWIWWPILVAGVVLLSL